MVQLASQLNSIGWVRLAAVAWLFGAISSGCLRDEDCRTRCECQQRGLCHAEKNACRATTEQDCRGSELCKLRGACTPREGRCVVVSAADCEASLGCQKAGLCVPKDGRCKKPE